MRRLSPHRYCIAQRLIARSQRLKLWQSPSTDMSTVACSKTKLNHPECTYGSGRQNDVLLHDEPITISGVIAAQARAAIVHQ